MLCGLGNLELRMESLEFEVGAGADYINFRRRLSRSWVVSLKRANSPEPRSGSLQVSKRPVGSLKATWT